MSSCGIGDSSVDINFECQKLTAEKDTKSY